MMAYNDLVMSYRENPRDVHTVPTTNVKPRWFYVFVKNDRIRVQSGHFHENNRSKIKGSRPLLPEKYDVMYDIYQRRQAKEKVSKEATLKTRNQVYWYGIFADMGL